MSGGKWQELLEDDTEFTYGERETERSLARYALLLAFGAVVIGLVRLIDAHLRTPEADLLARKWHVLLVPFTGGLAVLGWYVWLTLTVRNACVLVQEDGLRAIDWLNRERSIRWQDVVSLRLRRLSVIAPAVEVHSRDGRKLSLKGSLRRHEALARIIVGRAGLEGPTDEGFDLVWRRD